MTDTTHHADDLNTEGKYIPKAYQFERDMDSGNSDKRVDSLQFDEEANTHFIYHDMNELIDTEDGKAVLIQMIQTFMSSQRERLAILDGYSKGKNHTILAGRRRLEQEKSDYRVTHNWGGYISNYITGYLMSLPITVGTKAPDDDEETLLAPINHIHDHNDIDSLNFELGFDASRYGRAFELHYRDEDKTDNVVIVDPKEIFVIRTNNVSNEVIGAVHLPTYNGMTYLTVYTDKQVITYNPFEEGRPRLSGAKKKRHMYKGVPVVEWWNNRFRTGDFESEIPLIDAYDAAQSDTANYMSDLNDALLVINGDFKSANLDLTDVVLMKQANLLMLESGLDYAGKQTNLTAEYIYKQYDVAGTEAYKTRLMNDIYKLSNVPNLDDDRFYSGQSGVSLQYKMIGLEQVKSTKESFFTKALRRRYELIGNIHEELHDSEIKASDLTFTFHTNIPQDVWAEVEKYINAGGEVSQITLMEQASFIDCVENERKRIAEDGINPSATDEEREFALRGREVIGEKAD